MSTLPIILGIPWLAALALLAVPGRYRVVVRAIPVLATGWMAVLSILMLGMFDPAVSGYQSVFRVPGLGSDALGIQARFGLDGINVGLVFMGAVVAFAAACVSWEIRTREKEFYLLLLVMAGGILSAFASLDLFFLYFFHEVALIPTFLMIGVWGRGNDRQYATFNITLYLSLGALIALVGLLGLYWGAGGRSFDLEALRDQVAAQPLPVATQTWIFGVLMFGFGILVSLWPFHTWAPLGYAAAPTATAMLHAGVLKKFGLFALIRVAIPLLPDGARNWAGTLAVLALGNVLYAGWVAMRQRDLNRMIGYSSVAHMGFAFLGLAALNSVGLTGVVVVMVAHGLLAALSFGLTGYLLQQTGTLETSALGGLARRLPFVGTALIMALFAGCGLPGFANFAGEMMVFFGSWVPYPILTLLACWGALVIGGVYMLRAIRGSLHGPLPETWSKLSDAGAWRRVPFVLLLAALIVLGCWPSLLVNRVKPGTAAVMKAVDHPFRAGRSPESPVRVWTAGTVGSGTGATR